ncbi:MAG: RNA polymerase [Methanobacteriota archaeon]|nr:MAG: RNA polymerase [Euryarchaeota archaeon]
MVEEKHLSLAEIRDLLEKEKAARPTLSMEQQYALQHASLFAHVTPEQAHKLVKELMEIPMMSEFNAVKVSDLLPTHADDVRAIFAKERFALSKEDMDRVLEIVRQYL